MSEQVKREEDPNPNSNPNFKKFSDPGFNSHPRQQTERYRWWLSLTKKTTLPHPNLNKVSGPEFDCQKRQFTIKFTNFSFYHSCEFDSNKAVDSQAVNPNPN